VVGTRSRASGVACLETSLADYGAQLFVLGSSVVHVFWMCDAGRAGAHPYRAGAHRYRAGTRPYLTKSLGEHASTAQQSPSSLSDG
jgi:hypothetical protein